MSWPILAVAGFIAAVAIGMSVALFFGARSAYRRGFPALECRQRQTFALVALALGELAMTLLWIALYAYDFHSIHLHGNPSGLAIMGQQYIWRLMMAHAAAMAVIAIGDVVSARLGDWFEIKRKGAGDATGEA